MHLKIDQLGRRTTRLVLWLSACGIFLLGFVAYETAVFMLVQKQLRAVSDAAALSGTAAMASAPESYNYAQREQLAMTTALKTFEQNSIMQNAFNSTNVTAHLNPADPQPNNPHFHQAELNVILLDQGGNQVATGQPAASMAVQAWYKEQLLVSKLLPFRIEYVVSCVSNGGLPQLDIVLCMDLSGSMDDQTPILLVNRYWDTKQQKIVYNTSVKTRNGTVGRGKLFDVCRPAETGTALNVCPPQNLSYASLSSPDLNANPFLWSETPSVVVRRLSKLNGLRSNSTQYPAGPAQMPEQGMPPGNYDKTNPRANYHNLDPTSQNDVGGFTDLICDMGFPMTFLGFPFPGPETAVEASRGNMENVQLLTRACGGIIPKTLPAPASGYFNAYWSWVLQNAQPMAKAREAALDFMNTMNTSANCHFALEAFSDTAGVSANGTWAGQASTSRRIDAAYASGGDGKFPLPLIALNQKTDNFRAVTRAVRGRPFEASPLVPLGQTDIADALTEALQELKNKSLYRPHARRAVVLFTDGVPNLPSYTIVAINQAIDVAKIARAEGIPIYCIGLPQNQSLKAKQSFALGDGRNGTGKGIAYWSGNDAIYVSNASQLDQAFKKVARSLCTLSDIRRPDRQPNKVVR